MSEGDIDYLKEVVALDLFVVWTCRYLGSHSHSAAVDGEDRASSLALFYEILAHGRTHFHLHSYHSQRMNPMENPFGYIIISTHLHYFSSFIISLSIYLAGLVKLVYFFIDLCVLTLCNFWSKSLRGLSS